VSLTSTGISLGNNYNKKQSTEIVVGVTKLLSTVENFLYFTLLSKLIIMKRLLLLLPLLILLSFSTTDTTLTKEEKEYATKHLKETEQGVFDAVKGLSEAQLKFKDSAHKWSVEDCVKHIAISEQNLWGVVAELLKKPANPEKRTDIKVTDEQLVKMIADRSNKAQAPEPFKPQNTPYKSTEEALVSFKENRDKLISYIKETNEDFRNRVSPFGNGSNFDAYQIVLLISAHSNRHTLQIQEIKSHAGFPKS
jgi:hypothetical protein